MSSHIVKERMGLPIWDGDLVVGIRDFLPSQEITTEDFEEARQDSDEQEMLIQHNCYTDEEVKELARYNALPDLIEDAWERVNELTGEENEDERAQARADHIALRRELEKLEAKYA